MVPDPWTVDADLSLQQAAQLMRAWDVSDLWVTDDGELTGVLYDHDIAVLAIASGRNPAEVRAGDHAAPLAHWMTVDDTCEHAHAYMSRHALRRLPVVDGSRLVGTVWITDLALASQGRWSRAIA